MQALRFLFVSLFSLALSVADSFASDFENENLDYVVSYKWGLIHKDAGKAHLSLKSSGDRYDIILTGTSLPWVDKFYPVRDTLKSVVSKNGFRPLSYSKIAHEDGKFSRDDLTYQYATHSVGANAVRTKIDKQGTKTVSQKQLTGSGKVFDMLSVFYFLRTLNYSDMKPGETLSVIVFSGSKAETLTIRCVGKEMLKLRDKSQRESYKIKFKFTTAGKKKSSDDLDAWISVKEPHIPLQIVGSLPVGQVKCYYVP